MVAQYIEDKKTTWDELLPELNLVINISISDSTGFCPEFIVQGREPQLPGALYDEVTPGPSQAPRSPEAKAELLRDIFKVVRENTQRAAVEQRKHYDLRRRSWRPTIGSLVFVKQHHLSKAADNFAAKLAPKYEGPYKVIKFLSPTIVRVQHLHSRQRRTASLGDLKEAVNEPETQNLVPSRLGQTEDAQTTERGALNP
ncbi:uncharacterized protein [Drosophila kikkawai]|uniref:Uncharacterized protein n=1 Tax=Drosophila kikkawai TaxID=30033 RepID=A0ABM3C725_DROKI|nr:uncharacterized protein LOC121502706 [Drosophila kikkawai]